jgi:glyoxylase-like metal-dependent hydrolase (beta-lactamase superfamily II)
VTQIGPRSYNFSWPVGYYNTVFSITDEGVIALDPISHAAAAELRRAIGQITDKPIRYVVYSHDHLDHIVGAEILAPDAPIVAHKDVPGLLISRGFHRTVPLPTILVDGSMTLELGGVRWELLYLGPNHGRTNLAVLNRAERWVALIDVISPGLVPYRDLPLSDFQGYLSTLEKLIQLPADTLMDGHLPPSPMIWAHHYRRYFKDLVEITRDVRAEIDETTVLAEVPKHLTGVIGAGVAMTELMFQRTAERVVARLRPQYGDWGGFDQWAPFNVQRALIYLITGE